MNEAKVQTANRLQREARRSEEGGGKYTKNTDNVSKLMEFDYY